MKSVNTIHPNLPTPMVATTAIVPFTDDAAGPLGLHLTREGPTREGPDR